MSRLFKMQPDIIEHDAVISGCGNYRYSLSRVWGPSESLVWIGLNPSTADANMDDPTIRRCIDFSRGWGFGGLIMLNLFAFRATDPKDMMSQADPVGRDNDNVLRKMAASSECRSVAAWGNYGGHRGRDKEVSDIMVRGLMSLGVTKSGQPKHPLYVAGDTELKVYAL